MYVQKTRIRIYACACQKTRLTYFPRDAVKIKKIMPVLRKLQAEQYQINTIE